MSLYGIKDASNLTIVSNATKKPVLYADYCNKTDINFTSDTVYAMKKGVKAIGWDKNREGTFSTEMQVFDLAWIALLMGSELKSESTTINKREVLSVSSGDATAALSAAPKTGSLTVFKLDTDGITHAMEQTAGTPATTVNTYSIGTGSDNKKLTFNNTTFATGGKIVVYYLIDSSDCKSFTVKADEFPSGYTVIGDTKIKDSSNVEKMIQFKMNNVKPKSAMQLSMNSDDVATISVEWVNDAPYVQKCA